MTIRELAHILWELPDETFILHEPSITKTRPSMLAKCSSKIQIEYIKEVKKLINKLDTEPKTNKEGQDQCQEVINSLTEYDPFNL